MASGKLSSPGKKYGPCEKKCHHIDCKKIRDMAATICPYCQKEIGYETRFYNNGTSLNPIYVHAVCYEEDILRESK